METKAQGSETKSMRTATWTVFAVAVIVYVALRIAIP